jgi:hypothetical protein
MPGATITIDRSTITCPRCGFAASEAMPTDACQFFYECLGCGAMLRPKPGDCCVFCSYGSVRCPPIQAERASGVPPGCCGRATSAQAQAEPKIILRPGDR